MQGSGCDTSNGTTLHAVSEANHKTRLKQNIYDYGNGSKIIDNEDDRTKNTITM